MTNRVRPVKVTKTRQVHARPATHKPGKPFNGPNFVSQRASSEKKSARKIVRSKKRALSS